MQCRSVIRPQSMKELHSTYRTQCRADRQDGDTREDFKKCIVGKYGWLTATETFDETAFKATIEGNMNAADAATPLSDAQKAAVTGAYDTCITATATASFAFKGMMKCLIRACATST